MSRLVKRIISLVVIVAVFGSIALFFLLSAKITTEIKDNNLHINTYYIGKKANQYWYNLDLDGLEIEFISDFDNQGAKIKGHDIFMLESGEYENSTYGKYSLYKYKFNKSVIVLNGQGVVCVFNAKNTTQTKKLYQELLAYIN